MDPKSETEDRMEELETVRAEFLQSLPGDINRARNAYRRMAQAAALKMDAKSFAAHQTACKAGLSHLEGLIKLLRWASGPDGAAENDKAKSPAMEEEEIRKLIAEARGALAGAEG